MNAISSFGRPGPRSLHLALGDGVHVCGGAADTCSLDDPFGPLEHALGDATLVLVILPGDDSLMAVLQAISLGEILGDCRSDNVGGSCW